MNELAQTAWMQIESLMGTLLLILYAVVAEAADRGVLRPGQISLAGLFIAAVFS